MDRRKGPCEAPALQHVTCRRLPAHKAATLSQTLSGKLFGRIMGPELCSLPLELQLEVLYHLRCPRDIARAVCVNAAWAALREDLWRSACLKRWPQWASVAVSTATKWKRRYEILELRDKELDAVPSVETINRLQTVVSARHRTVLTEWMAEVSWDFGLDSTIVFKAVCYLDQFLSRSCVVLLSQFQLVGIACLRAAMADTAQRLLEGAQDAPAPDLGAERFAYISDRTYTPEQVEEMTSVVQAFTPDTVRDAPNAKMFLRSLWYRAGMAGVDTEMEMHIYTLASFMLQLSLLDLDCSAFTPSLLAAAALSTSLEVFCKPAWPATLQQYSAYTTADLEPCRERLAHVQATVLAPHLRSVWKQNYSGHSYEAHQRQWHKALTLMGAALPFTLQDASS